MLVMLSVAILAPVLLMAVQAIINYGKVAQHRFEHEEQRDIQRLSDICHVFMQLHWLQFWNTGANLCKFFQFSTDGTPLTMRKAFTAGDSEHSVTKRPRYSTHFLIQQAFGCDSSTRVAFFGEPVEIEDSTILTHVNSMRRFTKLPREMNHTGGVSHFFVLDGALKSGMRKRILQLRGASEALQEDDVGAAASFRQRCTSLWFFVLCFAHVCHNAFKNSILEMINNKEIMRSAWISFESLKNSMHKMVLELGAWLPTVLEFEDWDLDVSAQMDIWTTMGLTGKWLELALALGIRFTHDKLLVSERWRDVPGLPQKVTSLLIKVWKFDTWTDVRWKTLCTSAATLLAGSLLGLRELVAFIVKRKKGTWHIKGFNTHCKPQVLRMLAITATSSFASDAVLAILLKDDRLPRQIAKIDAAIEEGVAKTENIQHQTWKQLSELTGQQHVGGVFGRGEPHPCDGGAQGGGRPPPPWQQKNSIRLRGEGGWVGGGMPPKCLVAAGGE